MAVISVRTETYTGRWSGLTITRIGTAADADTTRVALYADSSGAAPLGVKGDVLVATGTFSNGQTVLGFITVQTITTSMKRYLLTYDVAALATSSATLGVSLSGPDSFVVASPSSATAAGFQSGLTRITQSLFPNPGGDRPPIANLSSYPNPFDSRAGVATIVYTLSANADTEVTIVDSFGAKVRGMRFAAGSQGGKEGSNSITWDGSDDGGRKAAMGLYVCVVRSGGAKGYHKLLVHH
jgi:hypothetical protein